MNKIKETLDRGICLDGKVNRTKLYNYLLGFRGLEKTLFYDIIMQKRGGNKCFLISICFIHCGVSNVQMKSFEALYGC